MQFSGDVGVLARLVPCKPLQPRDFSSFKFLCCLLSPLAMVASNNKSIRKCGCNHDTSTTSCDNAAVRSKEEPAKNGWRMARQ